MQCKSGVDDSRIRQPRYDRHQPALSWRNDQSCRNVNIKRRRARKTGRRRKRGKKGLDWHVLPRGFRVAWLCGDDETAPTPDDWTFRDLLTPKELPFLPLLPLQLLSLSSSYKTSGLLPYDTILCIFPCLLALLGPSSCSCRSSSSISPPCMLPP